MSHIFLCSANSGLCREEQLLADLALAIEATLRAGKVPVGLTIDTTQIYKYANTQIKITIKIPLIALAT